MDLAKRTYALPSETILRFEQQIESGKRSAKIAELIEIWIADRERDLLRQQIIEGCDAMRDVYLETAREWQILDLEADSEFQP